MPKVNALIEAYNAGELSEKLSARLSFAKYPLGAATLINAIPLIQGAFSRRPGSRFVVATKDETKKGRLFEFEFNTAQAYIIDAGENSFRFLKDQGQITAANITASITNGTFPSGIANWTDKSGGGGAIAHDATNQRLELDPGGTAASDIASAEQQVTNASAVDHTIKFRVYGAPGDKIDLQVGTASGGTQILTPVEFEVGFHCHTFTATAADFYVQFRSLGTYQNKAVTIDDISLIDNAGVEIDSPYAAADLFNLQTAQSADVMYICCRSYPTYSLTRSGHTSWSLIEVAWLDGPYLEQNSSTTTLLPSAATGLGINLTLSSIVGVNDDQGWLNTDIGRLVRYQKGGSGAWGYAVITSITSTTIAVADVRADFQASPTAATAFRLGAWSGTTGYPCAITFYEQRLALAGTNNQPQTLWLSQSSDLENMAPDDASGTVEDDDALDFTMAARKVNVIRWLAGGLTLVVGTVGGEWQVKSDGPILKPTDIDVKRQTTHGSAQVQPLEIGHVVAFVQRAGRKLRDLTFDLDIGGLRSRDLTILADHVGVSGFTDIAYQQEPQSTIWAVRSDGVLPSLTYEVDQQVVGWSRHTLGGVFGAGNAVVESVAVIPGNNGSGQVNDSSDRDEVWIMVKRTINGSTRRYIEFFEGFHEGPRRDDYASDSAWETAVLSAQKDAFHVDSGLTYDGSETTTITGLGHLVGETVSVWADGAVHPTRTVDSSGEITLDNLASKVQVGLAFTHKWRSLKLAFGAQIGTALGQTKRVAGVTLVLSETMGGQVGPDDANLQNLEYREVGDEMDTAIPLFSGEKFTEFDGDWESDPRIVVQGSDPAPFTCLAAVPKMKTNDVV